MNNVLNREFLEYKEIKHFKDVYNGLNKEITIHGTIKLHGTNFSVVFDVEENGWYFQSRTRVLEYYSKFFDYQKVVGICNEEKTNNLRAFLNSFVNQLENKKKIKKVVFYGELIGKEIQKKVALEQLDKKFVIFDVITIDKQDNKYFIFGKELKDLFNNSYKVEDFYCIENFKTWDLTLNPQNRSEILELQNKLSKITDEVEKECPFAKEFGVIGIGEGVVWKNKDFRFKVKGDKHSNSKVKTLKQVNENKINEIKTIDDIVSNICTENRLEQGLRYLIENEIEDKQKIKTYISWVINDTFKEEYDFIKSKNVDEDKIKSALASLSYKYFYNSMK